MEWHRFLTAVRQKSCGIQVLLEESLPREFRSGARFELCASNLGPLPLRDPPVSSPAEDTAAPATIPTATSCTCFARREGSAIGSRAPRSRRPTPARTAGSARTLRGQSDDGLYAKRSAPC